MEVSQDIKYKDRTIDIFGSKWKLKWVDDIPTDDGSIADGLTSHINQTISIKKGLNQKELPITVLHEFIHAFLDTGQYLNSSHDEPMVEWLARCFNALIKQGILKWNL